MNMKKFFIIYEKYLLMYFFFFRVEKNYFIDNNFNPVCDNINFIFPM